MGFFCFFLVASPGVHQSRMPDRNTSAGAWAGRSPHHRATRHEYPNPPPPPKKKIPPRLLCKLSPARLACRLKFALTTPLQRAGAFLYGDSHRSPGLARPFWQRPWYGTAGQASSAVTHSRVPAVTASRSASPGDGGWTDGRTDGRNVRGRSVGEKGKGPRGRFCSARVGTGLRQD